MPSKGATKQQVLQPNVPSRPKAQAARLLLPVCCVCGLVRDEVDLHAHRTLWITPKSYRKAHHIQVIDLLLTHTYCPACLRKARIGIKQFLKKQKEHPHDPGSSN